MPHLRARNALALLKSKLKYAPVVAIQGVRQCGKSTLARELLPAALSARFDLIYRTMDQPSTLDSALIRPETFLEGLADFQTVILDETQKAPRLFDAIKARVDLERRPGQYLLLGSTEFSKGMKIRESLTGRMSRLRLFPMTLSETLSLPLSGSDPFFVAKTPRATRRDLLRYIISGGMPGIFATRSMNEREGQIQDWVSLTVERDALQIPTKKLQPSLLRRVLREIATCAEPDAANIARSLRLSGVSIRGMLDALKTLFVIHEIPPHPSGTGKPRYFLCDPGIAAWLGASFERQLETWFYLEQLSRIASHGWEGGVEFSYYRTTKGSLIHGVWEQGDRISLLKLDCTERIDERELMVLEAAKKKAFSKATLQMLSGISTRERVRGVAISPWECLI